MAVAYIDSGIYSAVYAANIQIGYPATVNNEDYLLIIVWSRRNFGTQILTPPAGWSTIAYRQSNNLAYALYGIVADGTETGSVSVLTTYAGLPNQGRMHRFSGVNVSSPYESAYHIASTNQASWGLSAMSVSAAGSLCIGALVSADDISAADDGTYYVEQTDDNTTIGNDGMMALYTHAYDAGTSPADTISSSVSPTLDFSAEMGCVLQPATERSVNGVTWGSISEVNGVAKANIDEINGV